MSVSAFPYGVNNFFIVLIEISGNFAEVDPASPVTSGIRFNRDGTIDKVGNITGTNQRGTWWNGAPDTDVGDDYKVRALSSGAVGTFTSTPAADDAWVDISTGRLWSITKAGGFGTNSASRTWEIRKVGGSVVLDNTGQTVSAEIII